MTRYAVDLDGVLAQTVEAVVDAYNTHWGTSYTKDAMGRWDFWNNFAELQHLSEPKRRDYMLRLMDSVWNEGKVQPYPEASEFMTELLSREPWTDVVTGRGMGTTDEAITGFLDRHGIPYRRLVRTRSGQAKVYHAYDVYVDDDPRLALDIADRWPKKRMFLVDQPWNRHVQDSTRVKRIVNLRRAIPGFEQRRLFRRPTGAVPDSRGLLRVRAHLRRAPR